jgi:CheY-like chemotaxis protein
MVAEPARIPTPAILVVEDDATIRDIVRILLEEEGYQVQTATNGVEGLAALRAAQASLVVLLDWFMPEMTGEQLLQVVVADATLAHWHAYIVMSAASTDRLRLGRFPPHLVTARIHKPFDIDVLLHRVKETAQQLHARAPRAATPTG